MKFILLEAVPQISKEDIESWRKASDKKRGEIISKIIRGYGVTGDPNWRNGFRYACYQLGIDPTKNPFIAWLDKVSNEGDVYFDDKILTTLVNVYTKNRVDLSAEYFLNPSLYKRTPAEFEYTVNILDTVSNPSKLSKYFNNTENISIEDLYLDNGDIKPAGSLSTADDLGTIFGTVESWSGEDGSNEIPVVKVNRKDPANIKLTQEIRRQAQAVNYGSFDEFPADQKKDGIVVYFGAPTAKGVATASDWINSTEKGFYIYDAAYNRWTRVKNQ